MSQQQKQTENAGSQLVYIVTRFNTILGVYAKFEDAAQVASVSINKGIYCDIVTKPVQ